MRARRDAAMRLLKVMMAASVAIPLAAFGYASWTAYHDAFAHADEQLAAALDVSSEQARKVFQSIDLTFSAVDALVGDMTDEQIKAAQQELHLKLNKLEQALPSVRSEEHTSELQSHVNLVCRL